MFLTIGRTGAACCLVWTMRGWLKILGRSDAQGIVRSGAKYIGRNSAKCSGRSRAGEIGRPGVQPFTFADHSNFLYQKTPHRPKIK